MQPQDQVTNNTGTSATDGIELAAREVRGAISKTLEPLSEVLEADGYGPDDTDDGEADVAPPVLTRRVVLAKSQRVNENSALRLNKLFTAEGKLLRAMYAGVILAPSEWDEQGESSPGPQAIELEPLTIAEEVLLCRGAQSEVKRCVDAFSQKGGYVQLAPTDSKSNNIPVYGDRLLSEFFEHCKFPNEAEKYMLTEACDVDDVEETEEWFEEKRDSCREYEAGRVILEERRRKMAQAMQFAR